MILIMIIRKERRKKWMQVLIDTCVWSQALRRTDDNNDHAQELRDDIISDNRACITGPIRQEILSGIRVEKHFPVAT